MIMLQAYLFNDYWEDIGTIRSFFEANLALTDHVSIRISVGCKTVCKSCLLEIFIVSDQLIGNFAAFAFQPSKFNFYEAGKPMFTSRRNLPPSKIDNSKVEESQLSFPKRTTLLVR